MQIVPFHPDHLKQLACHLQDGQKYMAELIEHPDYVACLTAGRADTVIHNGLVMVCAGVFPQSPTMGQGWALLSKHSGRVLLETTRHFKAFYKSCEYARIETPVRCDFDAAVKWIKLLGFTNETPQGMKNYGFDLEAYYLYAIYPRELQHGQGG